MKTLYIDCAMGAAGDMLCAALLELLPEPEAFVAELNALGLPGVRFARVPTVKCGIQGSRMCVTVDGAEEDTPPHGDHRHSGLHHIEHLLADLPLSPGVRAHALAVYRSIAQAESRVHGLPVEDIHFHEVGTLDAVADVVSVCLLLERLAPERICVSPIHVGAGQVRCAHGLLPVPAPATALLLEGLPIYGGEIQGELCTPTGAALLRHFAHDFGPMPVMVPRAVGYGMGKRDYPAANCLRIFLGKTEAPAQFIAELRCNLDDMSAEAIGFAMERLLDAGALDVFTLPIGMKKNRPGTMLGVLCRASDRDTMVDLLLRHTSTLGVRETRCRRYTLDRRVETVSSPWGPVRKKIAEGRGVTREKYEYDDLARIAAEQDLPLEAVRRALEALE